MIKYNRVKIMQIQESGEMYLETILILSKKMEYVRSVDIGEYMGYSKPSVSRAVGLLKNGGFIDVDVNGHIKLTDIGKSHAEKILEKHRILTRILTSIGVSEETAAEDACKIEHVLSDETFEALKRIALK